MTPYFDAADITARFARRVFFAGANGGIRINNAPLLILYFPSAPGSVLCLIGLHHNRTLETNMPRPRYDF